MALDGAAHSVLCRRGEIETSTRIITGVGLGQTIASLMVLGTTSNVAIAAVVIMLIRILGSLVAAIKALETLKITYPPAQIAKPFAASLACFALVNYLRSSFSSGMTGFLVLAPLFAILYAGALVLLRAFDLGELRAMVQSMLWAKN
ncbi:Uncharacterised protein [Candidatus Gugararchaeum adminiculabundum]|nr:Uncharacterised protein [Candidatus Gugararchaeum adminiculabundum]